MNSMPMTIPAQPATPAGAAPTQFDWAIYADATLAGLAQLIPIPFVDSLVEDYFRGRMPGAIARRNHIPLHPAAVAALNASRWSWGGFWQNVLLWPFRLILDFLLRFVRKIVYFLTIKKAVDALNLYWQRAFLLNYIIRQGHLSDPARLHAAIEAMEVVLADAKESPLRRLARQLLSAPRRAARGVWHAWRGQPDPVLEETRSLMARTWSSFGGYFSALAHRYDEAYAAKLAEVQVPLFQRSVGD